MSTSTEQQQEQESNTERFNRKELKKARDAGASLQFLHVAREYPKSTAGRELRKFLDWGKLDRFTVMSGGFASALWKWEHDGRTAYGSADMKNSRILRDLFGVY